MRHNRNCSQNGMSLIELMFALVFLIATTYLAYLTYKPSHDFYRVEKTLAQNMDIVMAAQAYHSVYGRWPDEGETGLVGCERVLQILTGQEGEGRPYLATHAVNAFGAPYSFSCVPGNSLDPLTMTQAVPLQYLDYFRRYLYQVELPLVVPEDDHGLVQISTRVPPPNTLRDVHFLSVELGNSQIVALADNNAPEGSVQSTVQAQSLQSNQAFIAVPPSCSNAESIDISVYSAGVCLSDDILGAEINRRDRVRVPFYISDDSEIQLNSSTNISISIRVDITRTIVLGRILHQATPCTLDTNGHLDCRNIDVFDSHGWLAQVDTDFRVDYIANYFLEYTGQRTVLLQSRQVASDRGYSPEQFQDFVFDRAYLNTLAHQAISEMWGYSNINAFNIKNTLEAESHAAIADDLLLRAPLDSFGDCAGQFELSQLAKDRNVLPATFKPRIQAVMLCEG